MEVFEIVIALLLGGTILSALARRVGVPYPALVALAGAVLAFVPGTPTLLLDPELALALFVAPVLLDAAFDASPRDMARNWVPIASLSVGAVALTIVAVAFVVRALIPDMGWPAAIALGAIVAPPDAAAATAVLNQVRPPHRLMVILEGESLFNDASALLVYRIAVAAAVAGSSGQHLLNARTVPTVLIVIAGSALFGALASRVTIAVGRRVSDLASSVIIQFASTFAVWLLAEALHLSSILTMVVYAMTLSRVAANFIPARIRIPSYAVWEVVVYILNLLAFVLVGLQLKPIVARLDSAALQRYLVVAASVCAAAILARLVWVIGIGALSAWWYNLRRRGNVFATDPVGLPSRASLLVGWCGMRGIVTLATALALPAGGEGQPAFAYRDLILFTAFAVTLGTLVLQGITLRPLIGALRLDDDGAVEREVELARVSVLQAALEVVAAHPGPELVDLLQRRYDLQYRRALSLFELATQGEKSKTKPADLDSEVSVPGGEVARSAMAAERQCLYALRADGTIGDSAFQRIEQELDWREMDLEQFLRPGGSA
jgi:monovalent cation/hydrogen antiporter